MEEQVVINNFMREGCRCLCKGNVCLNLDKKEDDRIEVNKGDNLKDVEVAVAKVLLVEPVTSREDLENVESNNLFFVGDDKNHNEEEVVEPNLTEHGIDAFRVDEVQLPQVPVNVYPLDNGTEEVSNDTNSVEASFDGDLVLGDPLIKFVDLMRYKKKHHKCKGKRRKSLWTKNPLKATMFPRSNSRDQKENNPRRLKLGAKKGYIEEPSHKSKEEVSGMERRLEVESFPSSNSVRMQEEVCSDSRNRNSKLINQARKSMEVSSMCGIKFFGRKSYNIKKYLELYGVNISEQEIIALEELEDEVSCSVEF